MHVNPPITFRYVERLNDAGDDNDGIVNHPLLELI